MIDIQAAIHSKEQHKIKYALPKLGETIRKAIAINWTVVLLLPIQLTSIEFLPKTSTTNCLKEEIANSLEIIIKVGKVIARDVLSKQSQIRTIQTNSLSAKRSNKAPKELSDSVFLAIYPSK